MPLTIQDFKCLKQLTKGAYGKVYLGTKKTDLTKLYAIKKVSKTEMKNKNLIQQVTAERNALAISHCPYIVHLYYSLQTEKDVYLIMEYLCGGDLKTLIIMNESLSVYHASIYSKEIMIALEYLHSHKIIHRDLKPDNILISNNGHLKLTDFGLSKVNLTSQSLQLNEILLTPSKRKSDQNTDYLRTPNQLYSLMDKLEFYDDENKASVKYQRQIPQTDLKKKLPRKNRKQILQDSWDTSLPITNQLPNDSKENFPNNFHLISANVNQASDEVLSLSDNVKEVFSEVDSFREQLCSLKTFVVPDSRNIIPINASTPLKSKKVEPDNFSTRANNILNHFDLTNDGRVLGTPDYLPPEILLNVKYRLQGPPIDWWALGIIVFEMLLGTTPFGGDSVEDVFQNIIKGNINWPGEPIDSVSVETIEGLLIRDPLTRWGYDQLNSSQFIKQVPENPKMPFIPLVKGNSDTGYHDTRNEIFDFSLNHNFLENAEKSDDMYN